MKITLLSVLLVGCSLVNDSFEEEQLQDDILVEDELEATINEKDSVIQWNETISLEWSDFRGTPDSLSDYHAMTFIQIPFENFTVYEDSIVFDLPCYFKVNQSWGSDTSDFLLEHEQRHFDIGEITARKMRKELSEYICRSDSEATRFYQDVVSKYYFGYNVATNQEYDSETDHGKIRSAQKEWNNRVEKLIVQLEDYQNTHIVIPRIIETEELKGK